MVEWMTGGISLDAASNSLTTFQSHECGHQTSSKTGHIEVHNLKISKIERKITKMYIRNLNYLYVKMIWIPKYSILTEYDSFTLSAQ